MPMQGRCCFILKLLGRLANGASWRLRWFGHAAVRDRHEMLAVQLSSVLADARGGVA
jgi:hypothetical protein